MGAEAPADGLVQENALAQDSKYGAGYLAAASHRLDQREHERKMRRAQKDWAMTDIRSITSTPKESEFDQALDRNLESASHKAKAAKEGGKLGLQVQFDSNGFPIAHTDLDANKKQDNQLKDL